MVSVISTFRHTHPMALETAHFESEGTRRSVFGAMTAAMRTWLYGGKKGFASTVEYGNVRFLVVVPEGEGGKHAAEPLRLTAVSDRQILVEIVDPDAPLDHPETSDMLSELFHRIMSAEKSDFASDADSRATIKSIKRSLHQRSKRNYKF